MHMRLGELGQNLPGTTSVGRLGVLTMWDGDGEGEAQKGDEY